MTKKIQQLSSGVVKKLRSGIAFTDVAHCVEELVLNSIDAGANCIAVHLNLPFYQIQVIDNGCGIDIKQMKMIGTRYATSKCHTLDDLQNLRSGGFRGEALSSLREVSSVLMIESRAASSKETYCKIFTQGNASDPKKSLNSRPSKGTTVSVYDFMYNMPVRKNSISETLDLEESRKLLQSIALMYPNISFSLKNEVTGEMTLQLKKCTSLYHSFLQIFGKCNVSNLKNIDYQKDEYEINGCVSTDCHISKDLQFLYVNKRRVLRTKLHKFINSILNKAFSSRQKSNFNMNNLTPDGSSPTKNQSMCIFALNISCPYDKYDIIFEPRKTMIEFSDWHTVIKIVEDSLIDFLKRENLYANANESEASQLNFDRGENFSHSNFGIQDCKQGLFSNAAHRCPLVSEAVNLNKNSAANENTEITSFNKKDCTFSEESSPKICDGETNSSDQELFICPEAGISYMSMLGNLKSVTQQNITANSKNLEKFSTVSEEAELGIPCRSVFPSGSPVMLRVPIKSTLSDLQTCTSDSNILKLKEKFQYLPKKESLHRLNDSKFGRNHEKVCLKMSNISNSLSFKNSTLNYLHLGFNKEKSERKECNKQSLNNKSSQCPSVSLEKAQREHCTNIGYTEGEERSGLKATKDKSLQCPSVTVEKKGRIVSRFMFDKEPTNLPLQGLRLSSRLQRKTLRKTCDKDIIAVAEDLLNRMSSDDEMSIAKKFKFSPSTLSENSVIDINSSIEAIEDNRMDIENLPYVRDSSEVKFLSNSCNVLDLDDIPASTSGNSTPETYTMSERKKIRKTNFSRMECFTLNLQAFTKEKVIKDSAQSPHVLTGLDMSHMFENDQLHNNNTNISTLGQVNDLQNFFPHDTSIAVIDDFKSLKEQRLDLTDMNPENSFQSSSGPVVAENEHVRFEISEQNDSFENMHLQIPKENNVVKNMHLDLETSKQNSPNEGMLNIFTKMVSPNLSISKRVVLNSHFDVRQKHDVLNIQSKNNHEKEKIEDIQRKSSPVIGLQNEDDQEENSASYNEIEKHLNKNISSSLLEEKSFCDIDVESYPFTEQISSASDGCSLKQKSAEETNNNESVSNCISKELSTEPSVTEFVNMDVENLDNDQKSDNLSIEAAACNSCHDFENEDIEQNHDNIVEEENSINVVSDCSGRNDSLLTCGVSDKVDHPERQAGDFSDKKSENYNRWKLHSEPKSNRKIYIDTVTGNSAYDVPEQYEIQVNQNIETNNGVSKKSHFFLSHDYSPFISKTQTPENKLKENCSGVQNDLKNFIESKEKYEWYKKWRIPGEISNINDNNIENMLNEWDNPMFDIPYEVNSITDNKFSQSVSQMFSFLSSYRFSKNTLSSLQVIGQVDCKFIACILQDFNENCRDQRLLALFDQHAVHERIRLEELIEDLYERNQDGEKSVKTSAIDPPLQVQFDDEEIRLLHTYHGKIQQTGIHLKIDNESNDCSVHSVPVCLVHKGTQELRRSVTDSVVILQNSVKEWLTSLLKTRSIPQVLPKTLLSVVNYQACRGAVKFGDPLSLEQCKDLLKSLSGCKLPFQCAHGRPSVAPILDLKKIEALYKKRLPPQLRTLLTHQKK